MNSWIPLFNIEKKLTVKEYKIITVLCVLILVGLKFSSFGDEALGALVVLFKINFIHIYQASRS